MAINYYTKDTKLTFDTKYLFDIKSKVSSFGRDIDIDYTGSINRIVGLDKLEQQIEKTVLLKKGTYTTAQFLGTSLLKKYVKDKVQLNSEILESLTVYSKLQQQQQVSTTITVLGKKIYRTVDILDASSWTKINPHIISDNTYMDTNLTVGTTYYYSTTEVYVDLYGKTTETKLSPFESTVATTSSTLSAKVNDIYVLINNGKSALLYWNIPTNLNIEEQLRSILNISSSSGLSDPRLTFINLKVTNRNLTPTQINILRG